MPTLKPRPGMGAGQKQEEVDHGPDPDEPGGAVIAQNHRICRIGRVMGDGDAPAAGMPLVERLAHRLVHGVFPTAGAEAVGERVDIREAVGGDVASGDERLGPHALVLQAALAAAPGDEGQMRRRQHGQECEGQEKSAQPDLPTRQRPRGIANRLHGRCQLIVVRMDGQEGLDFDLAACGPFRREPPVELQIVGKDAAPHIQVLHTVLALMPHREVPDHALGEMVEQGVLILKGLHCERAAALGDDLPHAAIGIHLEMAGAIVRPEKSDRMLLDGCPQLPQQSSVTGEDRVEIHPAGIAWPGRRSNRRARCKKDLVTTDAGKLNSRARSEI
jgi:hypothetical protein